jgi:ATP-dependent RNA helicase DDX24/MAK5
VRCVIHYQIPASVDIYVHRSGRTARADADGLAIALVAPKEAPRYAALQQVCPRSTHAYYADQGTFVWAQLS